MQEYNSKKYNQFSNCKIQKQKVYKILLPGPPFPSHKYYVKLVNPENRPPEKPPTFFLSPGKPPIIFPRVLTNCFSTIYQSILLLLLLNMTTTMQFFGSFLNNLYDRRCYECCSFYECLIRIICKQTAVC